MANRKTQAARRNGYTHWAAYLESLQKGASVDEKHKVFKGECCATHWNNPNSKRNSPKKFKLKKD